MTKNKVLDNNLLEFVLTLVPYYAAIIAIKYLLLQLIHLVTLSQYPCSISM